MEYCPNPILPGRGSHKKREHGASAAVHPGRGWNHKMGDRYICPLSFTFEKTKSLTPNKIAVARAVCEAGFDPLGDCSRKVAKLCEAICAANGIEHSTMRAR